MNIYEKSGSSNPFTKLRKSAAKHLKKLKHGAHNESRGSIATSNAEDDDDCIDDNSSGLSVSLQSSSLPDISEADGVAAARRLLLHQQNSIQSSVLDSSVVSRRSSLEESCIESRPSVEGGHVAGQDAGDEVVGFQELTLPRDSVTKEMSQNWSLEMTIISGCSLIAKDSNGLSDPYVKIKYRKKTLFRTKIIDKCLNPTWNETYTLLVEDLTEPVVFKVFDHDTFKGDDFMGQAKVLITDLQRDRPVNLALDLKGEMYSTDPGYGQLHVRCVLHSPSCDLVAPSITDKSLLSAVKSDVIASSWDYTVLIVLVEGFNLLACDDDGLSDPYVRFSLQKEKCKSRVKNKTLNPKWMESISLHLYDDGKDWMLNMEVFDYNLAGRANFMGRTCVDLATLEKDKTHDVTVELEDQAGRLRLLITITGAVSSSDHDTASIQRKEIVQKYNISRSLQNMSDVGWLQVKLIRAHGLSSKDWDGKSDPFCTVQLVNQMVQSHTAYKTLNPEWNRVFTLPVKDIHSVLEITVYDEDKDMKKEFIGKVAMPLIMVENGSQKWLGLKDHKLINRVKGEILVELDLVFNHFKAAIRTLNPREESVIVEEPKFKLGMLKTNVNRVRAIAQSLMNVKNFWQSLVDWEHPGKTSVAFVMFLIGVWNFELYMLPLTLVLLYTWNYFVLEIRGNSSRDDMIQFEAEMEEASDSDTDDEERESKKSIRETIATVRTVCCTIQGILGKIADMGEAIKNSFNWTVPWLSVLAMVILSIAVLILFTVPLRYLVLLWGINKFTKKLRKPNYIPNNELLDYLSRVPSDVDKVRYKEFRPDLSAIDASVFSVPTATSTRMKKKV